eukprot:scaffold1272_cov250-Pinguiococcus_pyrenoidosus.AAC.7
MSICPETRVLPNLSICHDQLTRQRHRLLQPPSWFFAPERRQDGHTVHAPQAAQCLGRPGGGLQCDGVGGALQSPYGDAEDALSVARRAHEKVQFLAQNWRRRRADIHGRHAGAADGGRAGRPHRAVCRWAGARSAAWARRHRGN